MLKKVILASLAFVAAVSVMAYANSPADLNDLEIAHVAYTADSIDIRYAHLALAISKNPAVHKFAKTMIRDHSAVNEKALALLKKLNASAQDNFLSRQLSAQADGLVREMSQLSGAAFDRRYANNELGYHRAVNGLVGGTFIPNLKNPEVKALFKEALVIFKAHEKHAEMMVKTAGEHGFMILKNARRSLIVAAIAATIALYSGLEAKAVESRRVVIGIRNFEFASNAAAVTPGDVIVWINNDIVPIPLPPRTEVGTPAGLMQAGRGKWSSGPINWKPIIAGSIPQ